MVSATTTLVIVDPMSMPMEMFLIMLSQVKFLRSLHFTNMSHSFQMKHAVDNQIGQPLSISFFQIPRFFFYNFLAQQKLAFVFMQGKRQDVGRLVFFSVFFVNLAG